MTLGTVPRAVASGLIIALLVSLSFAQEKNADPPPKRKGSIKGKVMSDDGQPLESANVNLNAAKSSGLGDWRQAQTDDEGNFVLDGLASGLYHLSASTSAYVEAERPLEQKLYRLGDVVNFTLVKGGVITGRVTNALGEPVIAAPIRVERISDLEGRKTTSEGWYGQQRKTDDRGVYRVYGLPAGGYVVSVGGKAPYRHGPSTTYESDTPTFYPSATREGATEITVNVGEEVRGIDIRYRHEKGHSVRGRVTGAPADNSLLSNGVQVELRRYPGGAMEMTAYIQATDPTKSFEFITVADGEYELSANAYGGENKDSYQSHRRRVTVKGGNVANVELRLVALGSIEAKLEWEATPEKERKAECQTVRPPGAEETIIWLVKDEPKPGNPLSVDAVLRHDLPTEKGELKYPNLEAGIYRFAPRLLDEAWYIKSVAGKSDEPKSKIQNPKLPPLPDLGKQGVTLKPGEKRKDVVLTLASGAASVGGRLVADKDQPLPSRLRIHLVPAEKEAADDLLRYTEQKTKDGTFSFTNLAPGKYWLLARKVPDDEADAKRVNPLAWDGVTRKALRAEAEAASQILTLTKCQRVNDYWLRHYNNRQ